MTLETIPSPRRYIYLFGARLPLKKNKRAKKHLTMSFIIRGTIPSKKNMIWAASNLPALKSRLFSFKTVKSCVEWLYSHVKVFIRNSGTYLEWVEAQKPVVQDQAKLWHERYKRFGVEFPLNNVSISVYHYWSDETERDLTNKMDSITDLLVAAGVILNDNWQILRKITSESECYKGQVKDTITRIDVTQHFFE